jgi:hypothetical protein
MLTRFESFTPTSRTRLVPRSKSLKRSRAASRMLSAS